MSTHPLLEYSGTSVVIGFAAAKVSCLHRKGWFAKHIAPVGPYPVQ